MDRRLIVVARNQLPLCDHLRQQFFEDKEVEVLLDRRWRERRQRLQAHGLDRRRTDRRKELVGEDLRTHGFAVIRRKPEVLGLREVEKLIAELSNQIGVKPPVDTTEAIRDRPSMQIESIQGTRPLESEGMSNGNAFRKGRLSDAGKRPVLEKPPVTLPAGGGDQDREEWLELLNLVGIQGLRLPENGFLCRPWREFLRQLKAVK